MEIESSQYNIGDEERYCHFHIKEVGSLHKTPA